MFNKVFNEKVSKIKNNKDKNKNKNQIKEVLFFLRGPKSALENNDFYQQDIKLIKSMGFNITICRGFRDLKLKKYNLIFIWWWTYAAPLIFISNLLKIPAYITGTLNYISTDNKLSRKLRAFHSKPLFLRKLMLYSIFNCKRNLMVSKYEINNLLMTYPQLKDKITYYPHAFDSALSFNKKNYIKDKKNIYLLNIAWSSLQNIKRKNLLFIIEAFNILIYKYPNLKLILMGRKGNGFSLLRNQISKLNLQGKIILMPNATYKEKLKIFSISDIYLQPSLYEGFGLAILEAMSMNLPIITSDAGEIKTVVQDSGIYVNPKNLNDFTSNIELLIKNKKLRHDYALKALNRSKTFSFENKKSRFIKLLENDFKFNLI